MKKVVILGASGLIGSHLTLHYVRAGAKVVALTQTPGLVAAKLSQHCEVRNSADVLIAGRSADLIIDCSARPTNYGYVGSRHKYRHITGMPTVQLSTSLLHKEDKQLAPWANTEYIMDSYNAEMMALGHSGHVLRLPQVSIEGHLLDKQLLIASERTSIEHTMLEMHARPDMHVTLNERGESIRDVIKVTDVPKYVELALNHEISHLRTDAPKTIKEHIEHFALNYLGDPTIPKRVAFYSEVGINDHTVDVSYLPNLFSR